MRAGRQPITERNVQEKMATLRSATFRRRCVALVIAAITTAGVMGYAPSESASAASTQTAHASQTSQASTSQASGVVTEEALRSAASDPGTICLTNANSYCLGLGPIVEGVIAGVITHDVINALKYIAWKIVGRDDDGDTEGEIEDDSDTSLCLADTGLTPGVHATWQPCGADGTVWIEVPHSDGDYLYSRYSVDNEDSMVLTADPLENDAPLFVTIGANPGSAYWQTWSYYSA
jgi:hypothetical protein